MPWFLFCILVFTEHICQYVSILHQIVTNIVTILKSFVTFMLQFFKHKMCGNFREYEVSYHEISPVVIGKYSRF
jgi:Flp pilus assembly protein protease CpaA